MGEWNFLSDEERQRATRMARRPPLTWARVGQITGGTIACWTTAAVCFLVYWVMWESNLRLLVSMGTACLMALFTGAHIGGKVGAWFDRKRGGSEGDRGGSSAPGS